MLNRHINWIKTLLYSTIVIILSACTHSQLDANSATTKTNQTTVNTPTPETLWAQHQTELKKISSYKVNGSIAYLSDKKKQYARFNLNQESPIQYQLKLATPLGATVMVLTVKPNFVELIDQKGKKYQGMNVEKLLFDLTQMRVPLSSLHNILIGLSDKPDIDTIDNQGRLSSTKIEQDNRLWRVSILDYVTKDNLTLPSQIVLKYNNDVIKLKMNQWTL
ncbi:MAG: outer membrane lipoprotein LolB [Candidatus Schmidhempelia sp.]|nr:outer membrane lipoprotein LolB [Candidatus Schmidhempelia sp.]